MTTLSEKKTAQAITTVVESVYLQNPEEEPTHIESTYAEEVFSGSEPYQYRPRVTKKIPIDCGWIEECGMIHIKNKGTERLDVGLNLYVPPTASIRFYTSSPQEFYLDSPTGVELKVSVTVFPK